MFTVKEDLHIQVLLFEGHISIRLFILRLHKTSILTDSNASLWKN